MTTTPDPRADGISTNDYVATLPRRRYTHQAQGLNLLLPSSGLVVVPFAERGQGSWAAVVVDGHGAYPVGGYHVVLSRGEIETAIELTLGEQVPVELVNTVEEAEALEDGTYVLTRAHGGLAKQTIEGETRWVRSFFNKVSVTTAELAAEFPVVVRHDQKLPTELKAKLMSNVLSGGRPAYVSTPEEAEALPDAESILTPGGIVFRKWVGYYREGETAWCRFMHDPITTHLLDPDMHFPAKVLGTTDAEAPQRKKASRV
jgi:hypothetical protein